MYKKTYKNYLHKYNTKLYKSKETCNIVISSGDYSSCDGISSCYTEHIRMNTRYRTYRSPMDCWYNDKSFHIKLSKNDKIISKLRTRGSVKFNRDEIEYIYNSLLQCTKLATVFKPTWIITVVKYLGNKYNMNLENMKVLDPCAGWGCRLISFISLGCFYTGIDPNERLHPYYETIVKDFSVKDINKYIRLCIGFEDFVSNIEYDMIFTSPPFFDLEVYNNDNTQCYNKYRNKGLIGYRKWLEEWMFPILDKMVYYLKKNGLLCLNVSNSKDLTLFEDVKMYLDNVININCVEVIGLRNMNRTKVFPMLVYQKLNTFPDIITDVNIIREGVKDVAMSLRNILDIFNYT
eukprot:TRINITY_DN9137_c0_g1_i1.p1 TRINITY_DN9137_c0_g1~~TRINITY_DN9137_c0_g1_i1.p1  ORF type:complete len:348 (+),score=16.10 TRINITY_DN9137_c0_g1_i1:175-1218(+)